MNGKCNRLSLNEGALMRSLARRGEQALKTEAERLAEIIKQESRMTTHGGAPGKPEWREEIARNIGVTARGATADCVSIDVGYVPEGLPEEVRSMVVAYGSGDKAAGGGKAIHAGPRGRSVWGDDLSEKHPSRSSSEYPLPDAFNQEGNRFVENAMRRLRTQFGDRVQAEYAGLPDAAYHKNVRVDET